MNNSTPLKAIRLRCIDCSGDQLKEVRLCESYKCALYPYRMGKMPQKSKRMFTDEELLKRSERMKKYHENIRKKEKGTQTDGTVI